jgi:ubiquinone/menaquinone biosynthesis C-methylase UbiE
MTMATGKEVETRGHIQGFREEIAKAAEVSDDQFFTWFNAAEDKEAAFARGRRDFELFIIAPSAPHAGDLRQQTALEIGYGGGRLLAAAAAHFGQVIGIDIHDQNQKVEEELRARGLVNFRLLKTDGRAIPLDAAMVDFVYSFIVLQHVEKLSIFRSYMEEACRVLRPGGIAVLYFGRKRLLSFNRRAHVLYLADRLLEDFFLPRGYQEMPASVNSTNLIVSLAYAKRLATDSGFDVLAELVSRKIGADGDSRYGGQHGLVLRKR